MPIRRRDRTTEDPEDVDADVGRGGGGPVGDGQIGGGRDGLDSGGAWRRRTRRCGGRDNGRGLAGGLSELTAYGARHRARGRRQVKVHAAMIPMRQAGIALAGGLGVGSPALRGSCW